MKIVCSATELWSLPPHRIMQKELCKHNLLLQAYNTTISQAGLFKKN